MPKYLMVEIPEVGGEFNPEAIYGGLGILLPHGGQEAPILIGTAYVVQTESADPEEVPGLTLVGAYTGPPLNALTNVGHEMERRFQAYKIAEQLETLRRKQRLIVPGAGGNHTHPAARRRRG